MMEYDEVLADLKLHFGAKKLLSPEDIADVIGRTPSAQAILRSRGDFPIPHAKLGGKIVISIYDLAKYIANPGSSSPKSVSSNPLNKSKRAPSLSRAILSFEQAIQRQSDKLLFMTQLKELLLKQHLRSQLPDDFKRKEVDPNEGRL